MSWLGDEIVAWVKTFASAAVYATLIVTFGFQVARVEGKSMEPTLQDQDRLIVNKATYRFFGEPEVGDIVMLYYPRDPTSPSSSGSSRRPGTPSGSRTATSTSTRCCSRTSSCRRSIAATRTRARGRPGVLLLRHGRPPEQQLRQPALGTGPAEVHHRARAAPLVAAIGHAGVLASDGSFLQTGAAPPNPPLGRRGDPTRPTPASRAAPCAASSRLSDGARGAWLRRTSRR